MVYMGVTRRVISVVDSGWEPSYMSPGCTRCRFMSLSCAVTYRGHMRYRARCYFIDMILLINPKYVKEVF